uniref:40S ribosomal protein S3a n=1 Tax=Sinocyclocheilus grahami TaxID=75366 RepID=A0A672LMI9_SINGR
NIKFVISNYLFNKWFLYIYIFLFCRIPDSVGKDIEKACQSIYPLHDVYVRKVKMLKKPKFELGKLMELHGEGGTSSAAAKPAEGDTGAKVERADGYEPPIQESV